MNIGEAIKHMEAGGKVQRAGWNGKGMFLFKVFGFEWDFVTDTPGVNEFATLPFICMKTADNGLVPWLSSQTDMLAEDWEVSA
ncbi:DUF2829 domain-containing protein [uncultured Amphritea sp.]|uniref:DUF2829 domain-containing protein n=1 Tax=uncultured Amphritea sp. TaxID=981605 RepID=UPI002601E9BB|nr:DUF2829 domain-containing protein [uncultured Amphritea sp.]